MILIVRTDSNTGTLGVCQPCGSRRGFHGVNTGYVNGAVGGLSVSMAARGLGGPVCPLRRTPTPPAPLLGGAGGDGAVPPVEGGKPPRPPPPRLSAEGGGWGPPGGGWPPPVDLSLTRWGGGPEAVPPPSGWMSLLLGPLGGPYLSAARLGGRRGPEAPPNRAVGPSPTVACGWRGGSWFVPPRTAPGLCGGAPPPEHPVPSNGLVPFIVSERPSMTAARTGKVLRGASD